MTLTFGQGHRNRYGSLKLRGGYHHVILQTSCPNNVREKSNIERCFYKAGRTDGRAFIITQNHFHASQKMWPM